MTLYSLFAADCSHTPNIKWFAISLAKNYSVFRPKSSELRNRGSSPILWLGVTCVHSNASPLLHAPQTENPKWPWLCSTLAAESSVPLPWAVTIVSMKLHHGVCRSGGRSVCLKGLIILPELKGSSLASPVSAVFLGQKKVLGHFCFPWDCEMPGFHCLFPLIPQKHLKSF